MDKLSKVFGVSSYSPAVELDLNIDKIAEEAVKLCEPGKTFAVRTQRLDKTFNLTSQQVNELVGERIVKELGLKVRLKNPEQQVGIEIFKGKAYLFSETFKGPGGLPYGTAGAKAVALAEDDFGLLAAWMVMRRGLEISLVGKERPSMLKKWASGKKINWYPDKELFEAAELEKALALILPYMKTELEESFKYFGKGFPVFVPLSGFNRTEAEERMQKVL